MRLIHRTRRAADPVGVHDPLGDHQQVLDPRVRVCARRLERNGAGDRADEKPVRRRNASLSVSMGPFA